MKKFPEIPLEEQLDMKTTELETIEGERNKLLDVIENNMQQYEDIVLSNAAAGDRIKAWHKLEALQELIKDAKD